MTQKEKQILLRDLCTRLPHGVNLHIEFYDLQGDGKLASRDVKLTAGNIGYCFGNSHWVDIKPYLRPMSSMTKEEKAEYTSYCFEQPFLQKDKTPNLGSVPMCIDWLNAHHFDYRGLIPMGLALEAPEGMYV